MDQIRIQQVSLDEHWWVLALRGLFALAFAYLALAWPGITLAAFVLFFGVFVFIDGCLALVTAMSRARKGHRAVLIIHGIVGIAVGLTVFLLPKVTAFVMLFLIAAWALTIGIFEILLSFKLSAGTSGKSLIALKGLLSFALGALLLLRPLVGVVILVWFVGFYALLIGFMLIALSCAVHKARRAT